MRRLLATLAVLALAVPTASIAQSAKPNAPPGNSAIDEYLESVPSATGNTPTESVVQTRRRSLGGPAGRALRRAGSDGRKVEQVVSATAPTKAIRAAERGGAAGPA